MNANKLLNKFRGWALNEPPIKKEIPNAEEEFFAFHSKETLHENEVLGGLFLEWFLFDRKTTGALKTPVEQFINKKHKEFSKPDQDFLEALRQTVFGVFEVSSVNPDKGLLNLKQMENGKKWTVQDFSGSRTISPRTVIFARLIPGLDISFLTGWVVGYPGQSKLFKDSFADGSTSKNKPPLSPRDLLSLYAKPIQWEDKGADFCRNKLASLWQRWNPKGLTWKELENGFRRGDQNCLLTATQALVESLSHTSLANEALGLVSAYWNTSSGGAAGLKTPIEMREQCPPGLKEVFYMNRLAQESIRVFQKYNRSITDEESHQWLQNPLHGENGTSPFDLIYDERVKAGHPDPEKIGLHISVRSIDPMSPQMTQASNDYNKANDEMINHHFQAAAQLYESAHREIQYDPTMAYRLLGNLGICYAFLGHREKAMETFHAALKANPQYDLARQRLSELQKMTPAEYAEFVRTAPDKLANSPSLNPRTIKMINRHAISIKCKAPFIEWVNSLRKSKDEPLLSLGDPENTATTYLVPETDYIEDYEKTMKEVFSFIFMDELAGWSEDENDWPKNRTYEVFQQWFEATYNDIVLDLADEKLEAEDY